MVKGIRDGLLLIVSKNREYIAKTIGIFKKIHKDYLERTSSDIYTEDELKWINHFADSIAYKLFLVRIANEQLQTVKYGKIDESLWPALENCLYSVSYSVDEEVLISYAFESLLFEVRSFLDIFMIFICLLIKTGFAKGYMSESIFYNELNNNNYPPFSLKAKWLDNYFKNEVFGHEEDPTTKIFRKDWGCLIKSLRDKVAHRDVFNKSYDSKEKFINDILLECPTIMEMTYHSFSEMIGNGIHALFHKALCYIYELNWDDYLLQ